MGRWQRFWKRTASTWLTPIGAEADKRRSSNNWKTYVKAEKQYMQDNEDQDMKAFHPDHNTKVSLLISNGVVLAVGTIMVTLFLNVQKDANISLEVVKQHGSELLAIRESITALRQTITSNTADRYKGADAARDMLYVQRELTQLHKEFDEHEAMNAHKDHNTKEH